MVNVPDSPLVIPAAPPAEALDAALLSRGVCRALSALGFACLREFGLANGRRADIIGLGRGGELWVVEIKSSLADFRSDRKWPEYWDYCDSLLFAVAETFPREVLPEECGLMLADGFGAAILRQPRSRPLVAARRRAVTLRFALAGAQRLHRMLDPGAIESELL